jgi:class 3 adenylate cyclase
LNSRSPGLLTKIGRIGHDQGDSSEVKLQKTLLVAFAGIMGLMGFVWGSVYYYFNEPIAALIPSAYGVVSLISLAVFSKVKSYRLLRFSQLALSLILPFLLMWSLGGFILSSAAVMWSITSPLGALVFMNKSKAFGWFTAYLVLVLSGILLKDLFPDTNNLPDTVILVFFVLNIIGVSIVVFVLIRYFVGERTLALMMLETDNKWIKEAFSAYVSPNLVNHLIKHPEQLKLGGERRECSFVFTDLQGFTSLTEKSDPETVVSTLNQYIKEMTAIAFKHGGTIDKIVGDGIAVLFSAPVVQEDHALRAVNCALEMDEFSEGFSHLKNKEGIPLGHTRIGVNTGPVIVGNVGSESQFDYTAIGDAVNTTARLESANKQLGTQICVSLSTVSQCKGIAFRPIASLVLVGKKNAVDAFEPISRLNKDTSSPVDMYNKAFDLLDINVESAFKSFEELNNKYPEDNLVKFHLNRLKEGQKGSNITFSMK